ncbi:MAG: type I secretion C-terminal target domain-containing protein, partial [Alphaproteobacteria bacterium]
VEPEVPVVPEEEPPVAEEPASEQPEEEPIVNAEPLPTLYEVLGETEITENGDVINLVPSSDLDVVVATIAMTFNTDDVSGRKAIFSRDADQYRDSDYIRARIEDGDLVVRFQTEEGGDGADTFVLLETGREADVIEDFDVGEGDRIDISNVLSFDAQNDLISDFVKLTDAGDGQVVLGVDADGAANGANFVALVAFDDQNFSLGDMISSETVIV